MTKQFGYQLNNIMKFISYKYLRITVIMTVCAAEGNNEIILLQSLFMCDKQQLKALVPINVIAIKHENFYKFFDYKSGRERLVYSLFYIGEIFQQTVRCCN